MSRLGRTFLVVSIAALALAVAAPAWALSAPSGAHATPADAAARKKKKKKKKKTKPKVTVGTLSLLGFRVAATPRDSLTVIPPIPLTLTGNRGTITSCGSAFPLPVPTDGLFATLVIATSLSGKADLAQGTLTDPDGDTTAMTFSTVPGPATAVVSGSGALPILAKNGTYRFTATPSVKTGSRTFKQGRTLSGSVTISCSRP